MDVSQADVEVAVLLNGFRIDYSGFNSIEELSPTEKEEENKRRKAQGLPLIP